jgi:hypothetical protein
MDLPAKTRDESLGLGEQAEIRWYTPIPSNVKRRNDTVARLGDKCYRVCGDFGLRIADLALRHMAAPSLGHYASLSFVVIGRGQKIGDRSRGKKKGIFLWERLSAAILRFERFQRLQRFQRFDDLTFTAVSWLLTPGS